MKRIFTFVLLAILTSTRLQAGTFDADSVYNSLWRQLSVGGPSASYSDIYGMDGSMTDFFKSLFVVEELASDEFINAWSDSGLPEMNISLVDPDNVWLRTCYARHAFAIQTANYYLENAPSSQTTRRAEARLLRAYLYMNLIDLFGDVPFTTSSKVSTAVNQDINPLIYNDNNSNEWTNSAVAPPQKSRVEVFNFIETDLKACADALPNDHCASQYRPDKVAAWLLLARLYLNADMYTGKPRWTEAKEYAQKVIDSQYALCNNYAYLFMGDNDSNGAEKELILPVYMDGKSMQSWGATTYLIASTSASSPMSYFYDKSGKIQYLKNGLNQTWGGNRLRENLVWKFFPNHDVPDMSYVDNMTMSAGDDRAMFAMYDDISLYNTEMDKFNNGLECHKFTNVHSTDSKDMTYDNVQFADTDIPLLRKAEAYLIYAEADVRLNGGNCTAMGLAAYNTIRQRAHATTASSVTLDDICDEWAREFYGEAHRHSDLVRFGKYAGGGYVWPWKGGSYSGTDIDSHYNLYPLPTSVMQTSKDHTQNPGYYDINHVEYSTEYVDLGLSVKWATCNLGATKPEEIGNYYAWGDTQPKSYYSWKSYKYCNHEVINREYESDSTTITKYNTTDGKRELEPADDAATAILGGNWRMPTADEMYELCEYCYWQPTTLNGVDGFNIYGPNGNFIFLPCAGYKYGEKQITAQSQTSDDEDVQGRGFYWTSTIFDSLSIGYTESSDDADSHLKAVAINLDYYWDMYACERFVGCPIRPVLAEPEEQPSGSIPVAVLTTNADGETKTLTFTFADAATATAQNGEDGTYRLNVKKRTPGWNPKENYPSISKVVFTPAFAEARPTTTHSWFENCKVETIEGIEYLNTSEVTDMSYMFRFCPSLTTIDVTHFDTRNVTDMAAMFEQCHSLQNVNLSGFNTEKVTSMHDMFDYCGNLHYVDVSHFNTANVVDFACMFNDSGIDSIDVSGFNTRKAKFLYSMFSDCEMKTLDLSSFSFENAIDASELLNPCGNLTYLNMGSNDLKGMTFEYYDEGMEFNGEPFDGVGTEDDPCTLVINSDFNKSVLGEQYNNGNENYFKWHDGYFKVKEVPTGISSLRQNGSNKVITYRLDGTLVNGKPTKAGAYIRDNGKKRVKILMKP